MNLLLIPPHPTLSVSWVLLATTDKVRSWFFDLKQKKRIPTARVCCAADDQGSQRFGSQRGTVHAKILQKRSITLTAFKLPLCANLQRILYAGVQKVRCCQGYKLDSLASMPL